MSAEESVTLTMKEWEIIGAALGKQPFDVVAPLIQKIGQQISASQQPKPPVKRGKLSKSA